jgi:transcription-repair coupling factor (superfamily II helicase)
LATTWRTIRPFDRETQRSFGRVDSITLVPAHEVAFTRETMASASAKLRQIADKRVAEMQAAGADPERIERLRDSAEADISRIAHAAYFAGIERYMTLLHPDAGCALDYLPDDALLVWTNPPRCRATPSATSNRPKPTCAAGPSAARSCP